MEDVNKYDEHVRGYALETITVETRIKSTNKGFGLLAKMGWVEGQPLGLSGDGRVDPIPFSIKNDMTGLGKISQDYEMIESTVAQRRNLDSERMQFETKEQRLAREVSDCLYFQRSLAPRYCIRKGRLPEKYQINCL